MPLLKILQPIYYMSSEFERTVEIKLFNYGIILPDPEISNAKELEIEGIFRTIEDKIEGKKIELRYQKYLTGDNFTKPLLKKEFGQFKNINEKKLLKVLNRKQNYKESLTFLSTYENIVNEIDLIQKKSHSHKSRKLKINFEESIKPFGEMVAIYARTFNIKNINFNKIYKKLTQINYKDSVPYCSDEINKIIGINFTEDDYISMLIHYFVYQAKKTCTY